MGSVKKVLSTATGGLLGGAPKVEQPKFDKPDTKSAVDPHRGEELAAARKKKLQLAQAKGRSNFRIDLAGIGSDDGGGRVSLG